MPSIRVQVGVPRAAQAVSGVERAAVPARTSSLAGSAAREAEARSREVRSPAMVSPSIRLRSQAGSVERLPESMAVEAPQTREAPLTESHPVDEHLTTNSVESNVTTPQSGPLQAVVARLQSLFRSFLP